MAKEPDIRRESGIEQVYKMRYPVPEMEEKRESSEKEGEHPQQEQVHNLIFNRDAGWHGLIYDLINTEQLDPWNVNITILTDRYLAKIHELEENDFFVSSKVLMAAALLLRIKTEFLLNNYIKSIDEILFGKKEFRKYQAEKIELEGEIPELIPKSPMPRFKKVTLNELVESLNKAIITENRRIKKEVLRKNALMESSISLPKRKYAIQNKIKEIYEKLKILFGKDKKGNVRFSEISPTEKEEKITHFSSLLHLENQKKIWLEQEKPFGEIKIWNIDEYFRNNNPFADLEGDGENS